MGLFGASDFWRPTDSPRNARAATAPLCPVPVFRPAAVSYRRAGCGRISSGCRFFPAVRRPGSPPRRRRRRACVSLYALTGAPPRGKIRREDSFVFTPAARIAAAQFHPKGETALDYGYNFRYTALFGPGRAGHPHDGIFERLSARLRLVPQSGEQNARAAAQFRRGQMHRLRGMRRLRQGRASVCAERAQAGPVPLHRLRRLRGSCPAGALEVIGRTASVDEVLETVLRDRVFYAQSGGGMTLSGGEPMAQPAFAAELAGAPRRPACTSAWKRAAAAAGPTCCTPPHIQICFYSTISCRRRCIRSIRVCARTAFSPISPPCRRPGPPSFCAVPSCPGSTTRRSTGTRSRHWPAAPAGWNGSSSCRTIRSASARPAKWTCRFPIPIRICCAATRLRTLPRGLAGCRQACQSELGGVYMTQEQIQRIGRAVPQIRRLRRG